MIGCLTSWSRPDGVRLLASAGEDSTIRIWNPQTGAAVGNPLEGHTGWVMGLTSWRDAGGRIRLASASIDTTIGIWDAETGVALMPPLVGHTAGLWAVTSFALPDGSLRLASGGDDGSIRIWDAETGAALGPPMDAHPEGLLSLFSWTGVDGHVRLVSGGNGGDLRYWDPQTGAAIGEPVRGHGAAVRGITAWQTDDAQIRVASASADGTIRIWDGETRAAIGAPLTGHSGWMPSITSWSRANGTIRLASAGDGGTIRVWDPETGVDTVPPMVGHIAGMWALSSWVQTDGTARIASAGDDATIRIVNPDTGSAIGAPLTGHTAGLWALTSWAAADGTFRIASAGDDGTVRLWDPDLGNEVCDPLTTNSAWVPALTNWRAADGTRYLAAGGIDGQIRIWTPETGDQILSWSGDQGWVLSLTAWITNTGEDRLASGGADGTIRVWDPQTGTQLGESMRGHSGWVRVLTSWTSADGVSGLASAGFDGTVRLWDPNSASSSSGPLTGHSARVGSLTSWLAPDGTPRLASGSDDNTVRIWAGGDGTPIGPPLVGHRSGVWALTSWSTPDAGTRLASAGYDGTVRLWDPETGDALRTIEVGPLTMWGLSDAPASRDLLGREALAEAIAEQLYRPADTGSGPVVVSIEGPWGSGKSTLMRMVRECLPGRPQMPAAQRPIRTLTVHRAIRMLRHYKDDAPSQAVPPGHTHGVVTAWFNPWSHQSGEQVWAGLVSEIIETCGTVLFPSSIERETYWFRKNLQRIDRFALKRVLLRRSISPFLGFGLTAVVVPVVLSVSELNQRVMILGQSWTWAGVALCVAIGFALGGTIHTVFRYWFGRAARYLPGELFHLPITEGVNIPDFMGQIESVPDPLRRARAGSLYLLQHDVGALLTDLEAAGYRLVVFIDDLDRCRADTTAEVFEAVNLFLSGITSTIDLRARFVIGLDPAAVALHLTGYADPHRQAPMAHSDDASPGWAFLRKLVQLPVIVPTVSADGVRRFVAEVTGRSSGRPPVPSAPLLSPGSRAPAQPPSPVPSAPPVARPPAAIQPRVSPSALPVTRTKIIPWRTLEDHPEISDLIVERLIGQHEPTIRESKRLLNVWQLYERVLSAVEPLPPSADLHRAQLLVLVAEIVTRWPALQRSLHRRVAGRSGLQNLAGAVDDDERWRQAVESLRLGASEHERALVNLRGLLQRYDGRAVADLASLVL